MRLALVGTRSTHVAELLRHLAGRSDVRLAAALPVDGEPIEGTPVVRSVSDLVGLADGVAVFVRDPRVHRELVVPLLEAGLPVFVDKPLAASVTDVDLVAEAAVRGGSAVTSFSALRWVPAYLAWRAEVEAAHDRGEVVAVSASGPADPDSPYAGAWFYAVHGVELLDGFWEGGELRAGADRDSAWVESAGGAVVCRVDVVDQQDAPFTVTWTDRAGAVHRYTVPVGADYFRPAADRIVDFLAGGPAPVGLPACRESVRVTDALVAAWRRAGRG